MPHKLQAQAKKIPSLRGEERGQAAVGSVWGQTLSPSPPAPALGTGLSLFPLVVSLRPIPASAMTMLPSPHCQTMRSRPELALNDPIGRWIVDRKSVV